MHRKNNIKAALTLTCIAAAAIPNISSANPSLGLDGFGTTTGPVFNRLNINSANYNPSNGASLVGEDELLRFGVMSVGAKYEAGNLNGTKTLIDQLRVDVDAVRASGDAAQATDLARRITTDLIPSFENRFNGEGAFEGSVLSPVLVRTKQINGVWTVSATSHNQASAAFRGSDVGVKVKFSGSDPVVNSTNINVPLATIADQLLALQNATTQIEQTTALNNLKATIATIDQAKLETVINSINNGNTVNPIFHVTTASAMEVKAAQINQLSVGFSRKISKDIPASVLNRLPQGNLDAGVRLNAYQARLYREVHALIDSEGNGNKFDSTASRQNQKNTSALGLDLGLSWVAENYRLGATIFNVNSPKFDYPDLALDTNLSNQAATAQLINEGKVVSSASVRLKPHLVLEGSVNSANKRWQAQASYAANQTQTFTGSPEQFYTASLGYNAERFTGPMGALLNYIVPSARIGYRQNLVGTKLSTIGVGASWGILNIDANVSQQKIQPDGTSIPRAAGLSISVAEKF